MTHSLEGSGCSFGVPAASAMRKQLPEGADDDAEEVEMIWSRGNTGGDGDSVGRVVVSSPGFGRM